MYALACTCRELPGLQKQARESGCPQLAALADRIDPLEDIRDKIFSAVDENAPSTLKEGGVIKAGYNAEVDELRDIMHGGKGYLSQLEAKLKEKPASGHAQNWLYRVIWLLH